MENKEQFLNVFTAFAHYGFRKTSMADLAKAVGVSRQTLYNRFKTKEAILEWAAKGLMDYKINIALAELTTPDRSVKEALHQVFARWVGDSVELLHNSPHGFEIMDLITANLQTSIAEHHSNFEKELSHYLLEKNICQDQTDAADIVFLLVMSSKGLMLKSSTSDMFNEGMKRILNLIIKT